VPRRRLPAPSGIPAALGRAVLILAGLCGLVVIGAVPIGLLTSAGVNRALTVGFYVLGSVLVVFGFAFGNRGPYRRDSDPTGMERRHTRRRATREELTDTINAGAVAVTMGLLLVVIGAAVDGRHRLF
jgi:hypothetical protein